MKRILSLALSLAMVLSMLAVPALVQSLKWLIPEKELRLEMFLLIICSSLSML